MTSPVEFEEEIGEMFVYFSKRLFSARYIEFKQSRKLPSVAIESTQVSPCLLI